MKCLSPSHHHFERVADPFHVNAFKGIPGVEEAIQDGDVICIGDGTAIKEGKRRQVWYSVDWCGNLIGEWGEDTPPGEPEP